MKRLAMVTTLALALARAASAASIEPFPNQVLQCANPNGFAGYARIADSPELRPAAAFTVEAWVRASAGQSLSAYPIVLSKPAGTLMNGDCSYGFVIERATGHVQFRVTTSAGQFNATWAGNLLDGYWHQLVGIRQSGAGAVIMLMVDGHVLGTTSITGTTLFSSEPLSIGAVEFTGYKGNHFVGQVDEVRLWNLARSMPDVEIDGGRVLNQASGLVEALHFDRTYPDNYGNPYLRDSARGGTGSLVDGATLAPGGPPIVRGTGLTVRDVQCQSPGATPRTYTGAVRVAGGRDVLHRFIAGVFGGGQSELDVVGATSPTGVQSTLPIATNGRIAQLAARDSVVFCVKAVNQIFAGAAMRLFAVRVGDASQLAIFGDSLDIKSNARMLLDPSYPNMIVAAGTAGLAEENYLSFVDVTNAGAPTLLLESDLGSTLDQGNILDIARRGLYIYATFTDGNLRIYRYDSYFLNGSYVRMLNPVGTSMALGDSGGHVAVSGSRLYVADSGGTLRVYDLTSPSAPALLGSITVYHGGADEVAVDGSKVAVAGPNGVYLVDATNPASMSIVGSYCADMPSAGSTRVSLRGGYLGLTAGLGGYTVLSESSVLAVDPAPRSAFAPLVAGPNPSRGSVWFTLPEALAAGARLEIYDVAGRRVRAWTDAGLRGGERLAWDGTDQSGVAVAPGVYLARLAEGTRACQARIARVR